MKWINAKDSPPEYLESVVLYWGELNIRIGYRDRTDADGEHYISDTIESTAITHWIALPEPPEEGDAS